MRKEPIFHRNLLFFKVSHSRNANSEFGSSIHEKCTWLSFFRASYDFSRVRLPERAIPVGYAALIDSHGLEGPDAPHAVRDRAAAREYEQDGWHITLRATRRSPALKDT